MEQFFKIIHFFNQDENKESYQNLIVNCKEIDNLINKKYNFNEYNKEYDLKVIKLLHTH